MASALPFDLTPLAAHPGARIVVGFSGGLDSTVLLHLLANAPGLRPRVRAVHVDHGLQPDAPSWTRHCADACARLDVAFESVRVRPVDNGDGPEAAARRARHAALQACSGAGDIVALAHHRDDQAETFLLRALRASGPDGLAAMRAWRPFGRAFLWRPLLAQPRDRLRTYANEHGLHWIEDPSNADDRFDRNFLRTRVLPLLRERWPAADAAFAESARLSEAASDLLHDEDAAALSACAVGDALALVPLRALPSSRRARVLRLWIARLGLPPVPARVVACVESNLLRARPDSEARVDWHGVALRPWGGCLHAVVDVPALDPRFDRAWDGATPALLPGGGAIAIEPSLDLPAGTRLRARRGGERIQLAGRSHRHALKHVLQVQRIPPWTRERMPLVVVGDEVLSAGDRVLSGRMTALLDAHGARITWRPMGFAAHLGETGPGPDCI